MSNRVRTRESKTGETVAYSESAIRHNASAVEYCRTSMAALSGSTAGKLDTLIFMFSHNFSNEEKSIWENTIF